jgi:peptidylprolyl isomerase
MPVSAQDTPAAAPSPNEIASAAAAEEWLVIEPEELLVMTLAPGADGRPRTVVIQLMPAPFSQGWVENIRTLARAGWYDGISVNRVQDNYVVQWGDPGYDNPESGEVEQKPLPAGLHTVPERCYTTDFIDAGCSFGAAGSAAEAALAAAAAVGAEAASEVPVDVRSTNSDAFPEGWHQRDSYASWVEFYDGWPIAGEPRGEDSEEWDYWPVHCYGMVGVGRNLSPDTGSGAELYTVIGQAPRHLDRNIALVGRVISGMEHLTALPRGSGALGFYTEEEATKRTPILSVRVAADLPESEQPRFEFLANESEAFARYVEARANRIDPFFIRPAGGADICNIPVPVRAFEYAD